MQQNRSRYIYIPNCSDAVDLHAGVRRQQQAEGEGGQPPLRPRWRGCGCLPARGGRADARNRRVTRCLCSCSPAPPAEPSARIFNVMNEIRTRDVQSGSPAPGAVCRTEPAPRHAGWVTAGSDGSTEGEETGSEQSLRQFLQFLQLLMANKKSEQCSRAV